MKQNTHMHDLVRIFLGLLCVLLILQPVYAGTLDDLEEEATDDENRTSQGYQPAHDDDDESLLGAILHGIFRILFLDHADDDESAYSDGHSRVRPESRERGPSRIYSPPYNPVLRPSIRLDAAYQNVQSDVRAIDFRAEGGFDFLALQGCFTYYNEENPSDELWLNYVHGLLRLSLGEHLSIQPGAGAVILAGNNRNSGFSLTLPILIYPQDSVGFEFRPTWSWIHNNTINDYDAGLVLGSRNAAFRAGYRWVHSDNETLEGVYMGLTVRF